MFRIMEQRIALLEVQNTTAPIIYTIAVDKPSLNIQSLPDHVKSTISILVNDSTCNNNMIDPVKLYNLNTSANDNTIDFTTLVTAVVAVVSISSPVTMLKSGNFAHHDIK